MSCGNRRADIYLDDVDRQDFLKTLAEACLKTGWQLPAYCLISNDYHLVLETPNANRVAGMAWLQRPYTIRFNHRHKLIGHVLCRGASTAQARSRSLCAGCAFSKPWHHTGVHSGRSQRSNRRGPPFLIPARICCLVTKALPAFRLLVTTQV